MTLSESPVKPHFSGSEPAQLRLHVVSDLHFGQTAWELPDTDADIVILAGDISRPAYAVRWAAALNKPVLYVPGNHEFYGSSVTRTRRELAALAADTDNVRLLDNDELYIDGVRFLGTTLWTDFNLNGQAARQDAILEATALLRDFHRIASDIEIGAAFRPEEMEALYAENREWLAQALSTPYAGPTVVITHHAPSTRSIHPRFEGSLINTCFVTNNEDLMGADRVSLWIHGHTHNNFDYEVNGTRVLCNPRGYMFNGVMENPEFDPTLVVTVPKHVTV